MLAASLTYAPAFASLLLPLPANTPAHNNGTTLLPHVSIYPAPTVRGKDTGHFFAADSAPTASPVLAPSPAPSSISHFASPGLFTFGGRDVF